MFAKSYQAIIWNHQKWYNPPPRQKLQNQTLQWCVCAACPGKVAWRMKQRSSGAHGGSKSERSKSELFRKSNQWPIGSMYAIYGNIYHIHIPQMLWVMQPACSICCTVGFGASAKGSASNDNAATGPGSEGHINRHATWTGPSPQAQG
jgi:hypothetical protein